MRTRAVVTSLLLVLSAAGYAGTPSATAAPAGAAAPAALAAGGPTSTLSNGITFDHSNYQDAVRMVAEPDMYIDSKGGQYVSGPWGTPTQTSVFWKSKPAQFGIQWHSIGVVPEIKSNGQNGGGDTETTFSRDAQTVYASDLQTLICNSTQRSTDEGNSFTTGEGCFPGTDRQWMGTYDPTGTPTNRRVYLAANGLLVGCYFLRSDDDGLTYLPATTDIGGSCIGKFAINETNGWLYAPSGGGTIFRSTDMGVDWTAIGDTNAQGHFFSNLDFDTAGNLYQFWTTGCASVNPATPCKVFVATSPAGPNVGSTWTTTQVNTGPGSPMGTSPGLRNNLFPWGVAGDPGRVAIVWYGTTDGGYVSSGPAQGGVNSVWHTYASMSTNALDPIPTYTQVQVTEHPMHVGPVCTGGFPGCLLASADRSMADFFAVDYDPRDGRIYIAYNENGNLSEVTPGQYIGKPANGVIRLRTGPSLLANGGPLGPDDGILGPVGGTPSVAITSASGGGTLSVTGTHGLTPGNWSTDQAGDAYFPVVPAQGPNSDALDIREASVSETPTHLVFKMTMANLSPAAQAQAVQSLGVPSWLFRWWSSKGGIPGTGTPPKTQAHFFAKMLPGGTAFTCGRVGSINHAALGAPTPKLMTYDPDPGCAATGSVAGNTLTINVPKAAVGNMVNGDKIDHITAYGLAEHGPSALPTAVDQAKTFSYVVGTPVADSHKPDGYVEVSLDDPTFSSPSLATLAQNDNTWTLTGPAPSPGSHEVCARQVLAKDLYTSLWDDVQAGPVSCLTFGAGALPSLSVNDVSVTEGNAGTTVANFTVSISPALTGLDTASVHVATADGSATAGSDYVAVPDTVLSFDALNSARNVAVTVNGDTAEEPDETFHVNISTPVGAQIADAQGIGTIRNDDTTGPVCTHTGTAGNDIMKGTSGDDILCGLDGNDSISGLGGNDLILAGGGADQLYGGAGNDELRGEDGNDQLNPGAGNDEVLGGFGTNGVNYGDATAAVTVNLSTGTATGGSGTDSIVGIQNIGGSQHGDHLIGDDVANHIDGRGGVDTIDANHGSDFLIGGAGADTINGGTGTDTLSFQAAPGAATATLPSGPVTNDGTGASDTITSIENAQGSTTGGDTLTGSSSQNSLYGFGGDDHLFGMGGNDYLYGGAGNDELNGGNNNDTCNGEAGTDTFADCEIVTGSP